MQSSEQGSDANLIQQALRHLALVFFLVLFPGATQAGPPAHNLLIITVDTVRPDHLSVYGGDQVVVPHMERLAREGVTFDQAFTVAPLTLPAHASLFTGLHPTAHGIHNNGTYRLGDSASTLAEKLQGAGFRTGAVVGAQVLHSQYGLAQGFDFYDDRLEVKERLGSVYHADRPGREVVDRGLRWLQESTDQRWFLWLHLFDPHSEYTPPEPYRSWYADSPYHGEIAYADQQVGRVLDYLRAQGSLDRTLVVVTSDHGESLGEHGEKTHGIFVYDSTVRIPLLMRLPGRLPAGRRVREVASLVDVAPTVLELLDVPAAEAGFQGISLAGAPSRPPSPDRATLLECRAPLELFGWSPLQAVRTRDWKYIQAPRPELYGLAADPAELHDLSAARSDQAIELRTRLEAAISRWTPADRQLAVHQSVTARERRSLESLGYISSLRTGSEDGPLPDPKDRVDSYTRLMETVSLVVAGRSAEALPQLQELVRDNPNSAYLQAHLGNVLRQLGRYPESARHLRRSSDLDPTTAGTFLDLGTTYLEMGSLDRAAAAFLHASELNPALATAFHNLGLVEQQRGHTEQAIARYEKAIATEPDLIGSLVNLGLLYEEVGRTDEAVELYLRAADLDPENQRTFFSASYLLFVGGRFGDALSVLERAKKAHPRSPQPPLYKARVYQRLGDLDSAEREVREALDLDPASREARRAMSHLEAAQAARKAQDSGDHPGRLR